MAKAIQAMLSEVAHQRAGTIVADTGYFSTENAIAQVSANVLIATSTNDHWGGQRPLSQDRRVVLEQIHTGKLTRRQGAEKLGITYNWMVELAAHYVPDPDRSVLTDPDQRQAIIERVDRGELSIRAAARELGISYPRVSHLVDRYRRGLPDPARVRVEMQAKLAEPENEADFRKRRTSIEPVFGNIKANRGYRRFIRRGLSAVNSEWRMICAAHNLLKLWRTSPAG